MLKKNLFSLIKFFPSGIITSNNKGMALIITFIILMGVAALAIGLSTDILTDIGISGNLRAYTECFNAAESGFGVTEEYVAYSVEERGAETETSATKTDNFNIGSTQFTLNLNVGEANRSLYLDGGTITLSGNSTSLNSSVDVSNIGSEFQHGAAILMAAGYEGAGKGAGSFGAARVYAFDSDGTNTNSRVRLAEVYRYVIGSSGN